MAENSASGTVVGTVTGADPDAGAALSYTLTDDADGRQKESRPYRAGDRGGLAARAVRERKAHG